MRPAPRIALCTVAALLGLPAVASGAGTWQRPVPGEVLRGFAYGPDPFRAGQHRGVDLATRPGARVRSACAGRVTFAGAAVAPSAASGGQRAANGVVSVRCGSWRLSYLPLRDVRVRLGWPVRPGTALGRVGHDPRHAGLHVGVRREGRRWAYVDPLALLAPPPPPPLPPSPPPSPRGRGRPPTLPRVAPSPRPPETVARPQLLARPAPAARPVAPWPVWLGLALVLAGGLGAGAARQRAGRRRERRGAPATAAARAR